MAGGAVDFGDTSGESPAMREEFEFLRDVGLLLVTSAYVRGLEVCSTASSTGFAATSGFPAGSRMLEGAGSRLLFGLEGERSLPSPAAASCVVEAVVEVVVEVGGPAAGGAAARKFKLLAYEVRPARGFATTMNGFWSAPGLPSTL